MKKARLSLGEHRDKLPEEERSSGAPCTDGGIVLGLIVSGDLRFVAGKPVCVFFSSHNEQLGMADGWRYTYSGLGFCQVAPTEWESREELRVSAGGNNSDHRGASRT